MSWPIGPKLKIKYGSHRLRMLRKKPVIQISKEETKMKTFREFMIETEEVNELSKKTLGSYIKKAAVDMSINRSKIGAIDAHKDTLDHAKNTINHEMGKHGNLPSQKWNVDTSNSDNNEVDKVKRHFNRKIWSRTKGIDNAVKKLTKD